MPQLSKFIDITPVYDVVISATVENFGSIIYTSTRTYQLNASGINCRYGEDVRTEDFKNRNENAMKTFKEDKQKEECSMRTRQ